MNAYVSAVAALSAGDDATRDAQSACVRIKLLAAHVLSAFDKASSGELDAAELEFGEGIAAVQDELKTLISNPVDFGTLYRVRRGGVDAAFERAELFHVPFERAEKLVRSGRYNPDGVPVLYLGGSLVACWLEARRPTYDVWAAAVRLRPDASLRVLNLGYRTAQIADMVRMALASGWQSPAGIVRIALALVVIWPLLAACSFAAGEDDPDRPEYLIPQQLMRWVSCQHDVAGIRYFSTRIAAGDAAIAESASFVFPTHDDAQRGVDARLAAQFEMTAPMFWATLPAGLQALEHATAKVKMASTTFGRFEGELQKKPFAPVVQS